MPRHNSIRQELVRVVLKGSSLNFHYSVKKWLVASDLLKSVLPEPHENVVVLNTALETVAKIKVHLDQLKGLEEAILPQLNTLRPETFQGKSFYEREARLKKAKGVTVPLASFPD